MEHEVKDAATVVCVREVSRKSSVKPRWLCGTDYDLIQQSDPLPRDFNWKFTSNLQVLMGQNEVINWVRSKSETDLSIMRYPGEYKFAGGTKDDEESIMDTAKRELREEFPIEIPHNAVLRFLKQYSTRPVQGRSYHMHNFVALANENSWIHAIDIQQTNARLQTKRATFDQLLETGAFWKLNKVDREKVSPEVNNVQWLDIQDAVHYCLTSKAKKMVCVNDYQRNAFSKYHINKRDPMFATMFFLLDLERLGTLENIRKATTNTSSL